MEFKTASLYEMNKQLSANESKLGAAARKQAQENVRLWFRDKIEQYGLTGNVLFSKLIGVSTHHW